MTHDASDTSMKTRPRGYLDVLLVAVILGALVGLTIFVVDHYHAHSTDAATILGIVVPAFATIGAAAFGLTVAYKAGAAKGEASGAAQAKDAAEQAVSSTVAPVSYDVDRALEAVRRSRADLETAGYNPPGETGLMFAPYRLRERFDEPTEPITVDRQPLHDAEAWLMHSRGVLDGIQAAHGAFGGSVAP
jgi:hypothetical protein